METSSTTAILATTAALWFAGDQPRPGRLNRRLAEHGPAAASGAPLTWRSVLDDMQPRQIDASLVGRRNDSAGA